MTIDRSENGSAKGRSDPEELRDKWVNDLIRSESLAKRLAVHISTIIEPEVDLFHRHPELFVLPIGSSIQSPSFDDESATAALVSWEDYLHNARLPGRNYCLRYRSVKDSSTELVVQNNFAESTWVANITLNAARLPLDLVCNGEKAVFRQKREFSKEQFLQFVGVLSKYTDGQGETTERNHESTEKIDEHTRYWNSWKVNEAAAINLLRVDFGVVEGMLAQSLMKPIQHDRILTDIEVKEWVDMLTELTQKGKAGEVVGVPGTFGYRRFSADFLLGLGVVLKTSLLNKNGEEGKIFTYGTPVEVKCKGTRIGWTICHSTYGARKSLVSFTEGQDDLYWHQSQDK